MDSCHEEDDRDWNRAGMKLPIPLEAWDRHDVRKTNGTSQ
eukprot:gene26883-biopygen17468